MYNRGPENSTNQVWFEEKENESSKIRSAVSKAVNQAASNIRIIKSYTNIDEDTRRMLMNGSALNRIKDSFNTSLGHNLKIERADVIEGLTQHVQSGKSLGAPESDLRENVGLVIGPMLQNTVGGTHVYRDDKLVRKEFRQIFGDPEEEEPALVVQEEEVTKKEPEESAVFQSRKEGLKRLARHLESMATAGQDK